MITYDLFDIVSPGDRVDIQKFNDRLTDNDDREYYITKVLDVDEDGDVEILMPMEKMKMILLGVDEEYDMFFYARKGIFTCRARVVKRYKDELLYVARLSQVTELEKQQRREYYRYDCVIGMNSRQLNEAEAMRFTETNQTILLNDPQDKSVIVDISGGGLRFVSAENYDNGSLVYCRFMLTVQENSKVYDCVVRLLSSYPVVNNKKNTEYRGQFMNISEHDREDIIKYIFEEERRIRHR